MLALLWLLGCNGDTAVDPECQGLCDELVVSCEYDAFPTYDSCMEGCLYDKKKKADIAGELTCIQDASCDTFAVLECQHRYGVSSE